MLINHGKVLGFKSQLCAQFQHPPKVDPGKQHVMDQVAKFRHVCGRSGLGSRFLISAWLAPGYCEQWGMNQLVGPVFSSLFFLACQLIFQNIA